MGRLTIEDIQQMLKWEEQLKDLTRDVDNYHRRMKCLEQAIVESGEGYGKIFRRANELYKIGE